ncbi:LPS export ABC transporter periplasmic protein LptC [Pragia fontium]|uniref:Lipopolysaccharide export system protein LptC n=2 Tax=Pragia fontium TaxID=82985 RepID=A0AAJ4W9P0_9GAMM|nr:LPS export ABC transporter periplasmic protein LptC [Pragia fontium]AKJ43273.1 lipopolysaccharide transporter [Pragia fontium]SFC59948.1 lipopolysaccharide export system protein LptC [Pragia fontium DSM 5563 = ATCC 49100]SUB83732.1 Lipopolysaccharide export system protein lptC [Pragia fontium]VEJ56638.1 Lipopolysaccharide export system protein lptC [Pragia fontium]GKX64093.1 lipopolysaccharide export system protein LptC [Pragia fontium]
MSKAKLSLTIILTLIALGLIGWNLTDFKGKKITIPPDDKEPTYQTQQMVTIVYNPEGQLSYKLTAEDVKYYAAPEDTWFTKPVMIMYDKDHVATWSVRSDRAKLTKERMLYLYDNVEVNSLTTTSQLERIKTNSAEVNLITQDISSDDNVTLYGANFTSEGMKMRGNLRNKTAKLIEKVKTYYEVQPRAGHATNP